MILPTTYLAALLLLIVSMVCWGSWANTQKMAGRWRFELFYYDYSIGVLVTCLVAAYTFGTMSPGQDLTFQDNFLISSYHKMSYGVASGVVFNLANILLVAAISISGMSVAFPISIGLALIIGVVWNYIINPQGNPALIFGGAALILVAIVLDALAYKRYAGSQPKVTDRIDPRTKKAIRPPSPAKGIALAIGSGILMGVFYPLLEFGKTGEASVSPYGIAILFGVGVVLSTLLYVPFFMSFPVFGQPLEIKEYFKGTKGQHAWGLFGGILWAIGAVANFVASSAPASLQVGPAVSYALGQGATLISALWGVFVWKEFKGAVSGVKLLLGLMFLCFIAGLTLVSLAPLAGK